MSTTQRKSPSPDANIIGSYIRDRRQAAGLRQLDLAKAARVAASTVSRIESGEILPKVNVLTRIGTALDLDLSELLGMLGSRTGRELPELEDYLRAKYKLSEEAIGQVAAHFKRIAMPEFGTDEPATVE